MTLQNRDDGARTDAAPARGYPRPQLRRAGWISLDGVWDFALDREARWARPADVAWNATIVVPFAPETARSGVNDPGFFRACWYRRRLEPIAPGSTDRWILHFGAVDYAATVWLDDVPVGAHRGGYTPFEMDVTARLGDGRPHELVVRAEDDPQDLAKPRGKQDWHLLPHSIWYPRTTGIWQTVWLERAPAQRITRLRWTSNLARWEIGLEAQIACDAACDLRLELRLSLDGQVLARDAYDVTRGEVHRRIALSDPGIDDSRNTLLWSPSSPTLIQADLRLLDAQGVTLDTVKSYTAIRAIAVQGDRIVLNGRPITLRMVLDQGYWPESGITAPDDAALRHDVELARAMGFNGVRKHQKIEDPRYLYWADRLGLLVWEEMPSAYRFTGASVERLTCEWLEVLARDYSHPCIVAWVPFNESWGVPNLPDSEAERHYVQALYHLTRTLDPTRPVVGNDGWESTATDIIGIHDYEERPELVARRYHAEDMRPRLFRRERPGGRVLVLEGHTHGEYPIVLSEFGGIMLAPHDDDAAATWGYSRCHSADEFAERYTALLTAVHSLGLLAGFCYTQFADTYQEANGLLHADRTPKFPLAAINAATRGPRAPHDLPTDRAQDEPRAQDADPPPGDRPSEVPRQ